MLEKIQNSSNMASIVDNKKVSEENNEVKRMTNNPDTNTEVKPLYDKIIVRAKYEMVANSGNSDEQTHKNDDNKCCFELKNQVDTLLSELVSARERCPTLLRELATAEERYSTLLEDYQTERRHREELEKSLFILPD